MIFPGTIPDGSYDAFLKSKQKSVTAYIIFNGWNSLDLFYLSCKNQFKIHIFNFVHSDSLWVDAGKMMKQGRIHGPKSLLEGQKAKALPTHGRTDGRTDGQTHPLIESLRCD